MITAERERDLIIRAKAGDNGAAWELLSAHEGFLRKQAAKMRGDFDDMLQEARIGALKAIADFDVTKGFRFLTYAGWKMQHELQLAKNAAQPIRTPVNWGHRSLSDEQAAIANRARKLQSLDAPVGDGDSPTSIGRLLAGEGDVLDAVDRQESQRKVTWAISMLPPRSARIVRARMDGDSYQEAGGKAGISYARVQRLESTIHERLRRLIGCQVVRPRPEIISRLGSNARAVMDRNTGQVFPTVSACAAAIGASNVTAVCRAIRHREGDLLGFNLAYAADAPRVPTAHRIDPRARGVVHVASGEYFHSLTQAAKRFRLNQAALWKSMNMGRKRGDYGGHQFIYAVEPRTVASAAAA